MGCGDERCASDGQPDQQHRQPEAGAAVEPVAAAAAVAAP